MPLFPLDGFVTPTFAERHQFILQQGQRDNDTAYIYANESKQSVATKYGAHIMRSKLETQWAERFERSYTAAPAHQQAPVTKLPAYFYEPRGMKRWPTYIHGKHYRIDFVLVTAVKDIDATVAASWMWISIKPKLDRQDIQSLVELVTFDSLHQTAYQCIGLPYFQRFVRITWRDNRPIVEVSWRCLM